jgi:Asp-tRNA(Asn)/Glu-tRNA(Gln) amidotransferase A subunit family amidase
VTGHRPTFGRVSRHGAMALSWTMDKIGPMCRSAEDCALVFAAIHGADGKDPTARDAPFNWDATRRITDLRIGYLKSGFEGEPANDQARQRRALDEATLAVLRGLGVRLVPVEMPAQYPLNAIRNCVLNAESAAAFDELTRSGRVNQVERSSWPTSFRQARMIPAVEYIQANRVRTLVMRALAEVMNEIDVFVAPNTGNSVLVLTNLTGHPQVCVPHGFTGEPATPVSISFVGKLYGDADVLLVAKAFQDATDFHKRKPPLFV